MGSIRRPTRWRALRAFSSSRRSGDSLSGRKAVARNGERALWARSGGRRAGARYEHFHRAVELVTRFQGEKPWREMVSARYGLDQAADALARATSIFIAPSSW